VYALPGLEALLERPVAAVLGFALPLPADPHGLGLLPRLVSLSPDGQLALARPAAPAGAAAAPPNPGACSQPDALGARTSLRSGRRACLWPLAGQQVVLAGRTGQRAPRPVAAGRAPPAGAERRRRRAGGPQRGAGAHRPGALAAAARAPDRALRLGPGRRRARGRRRATRAVRGCAADGAAALVRRAPPTARGRAAHAHALRVSWDSRRPPRSPAPGGRCADRARAGPADGALRARAQAS
jgi:hypothetical protein